MLSVSIEPDDGIAILKPEGALSESDFETAAMIVDPYIEEFGSLKGVMIHTRSFPGWDSFAALLAHMRFVKDHHKNIMRVAIVTDSPIGNFAESVASHFVEAEIRHFRYDERDPARSWLLGGAC